LVLAFDKSLTSSAKNIININYKYRVGQIRKLKGVIESFNINYCQLLPWYPPEPEE
jgi:hypothetical protein